MPKVKLTKTAVDAATPQERDYELRDTMIPGFLVKITPAGRKIFMVAYVAHNGLRRKPAIGRYGEITVEQARNIAQDWLAEVRRGVDPSADRAAARQALTVKELFDRFITDYSESRNKPATVHSNRGYGKRYIIPILGHLKVPDVTRADIAHLMKKMAKAPTNANRVLAAVRKMFNMAEVWGMRPDGSNPCRHVPKYPERGKTRLITDVELRKLFEYLDRAEGDGLEHPFILLAIRLQFEFAARMSEILQLEWAWIDFDNRRVVWPDSKTGGMSKPMSAEAVRLLETAPRLEGSPFVCPSVFDTDLPMSKHTYYHVWRRILQRAGLPHIGTHGIRHRSATDIANSGVSVKVGMALTAHKTVTMFMKYVHTEDDPVRAAAEAVTQRRLPSLAVCRYLHHSPSSPHPSRRRWRRLIIKRNRPLQGRTVSRLATKMGSTPRAPASETIGLIAIAGARTAPFLRERSGPRQRRQAMAKARSQRPWPTPDILQHAKFVDDTGPIRLVDTEGRRSLPRIGGPYPRMLSLARRRPSIP